MPMDLKVSVSKELNRLKREIARKTSELASLKGELKRHLRVFKFLGAGPRGRGKSRGRGRKRMLVNWNAVLEGLPRSFSIDDLAKRAGAKTKSRLYLRQVLVRWRKQGKTKRTGRARYQKA